MNKSDFIFKYRIRNWREYNRALVGRGSITLWVDEQTVAAWRNEEMAGRRGRPRIYTNTAIECALIVEAIFHLSLRAAQGLLESVVRLISVELPVPDYTTVSRRHAGLNVMLAPAGSPTAATSSSIRRV